MAEEIQISELELAEELLQDMVLPVETATDTKAATLLQLKKWLGSSLPVGFIIPAVGRIEDSRFTLLDGKTLAKEGTYRDFYNKVVEQVQKGNWFSCTQEEYNNEIATYGQCGRFVIETDYVRIPTITRYIGATVTLSEFGQAFNESLPNIKGGVGACTVTSITSNPFYISGSSSKGSSQDGTDDLVYMDLSRSSSIYQDGAKVNVEHIKYPYYMVISTEGQTTPISVDINKVYEDINLKANKDLSDVTQIGKETVVGWGMPSNRYDDLTLGASGTTYTAHADGYVFIAKSASNNQFLSANVLNNSDYIIKDYNIKALNSANLTLFFPIKKGMDFTVYYDASGTTNYFRFIYAEGEK